MRRRFWLLFTAICILLGLALTASAAETVASGTCGDNLTWTLDSEGTLTISGTGDMKDYRYYEDGITITPWYFKSSSIKTVLIEPGVTSLGAGAFYGCSSLTNVTISDSVTSIGDYAFYNCSSLTGITIGDSVTSIGDYAFSGCGSLTGITIPDSVTSIGDHAFFWCTSLTSITGPDSVTSIGDYAFYNCYSLTGITIPDSVTSIGDYAFSFCSSLTGITIPDSVTSIGVAAFEDCSSLTGIWVDQANQNYSSDTYGVLFNKDQSALIAAPGGIIGSYVIPDSVTSIGNYAFSSCYSLTSVTIPDSVISIGDWTFSACVSLTYVTIPDSVTSIGKYAFFYCSLTKIEFCGSAPQMGSDLFADVTATAYYPANNPTWTEEVMQDYGGDITWVPNGQQEKFDLAGANLELSNDITMYFYVNAADVADGYYMEIVKTNADGSKVTKKVEKADWTAYGSTMYFVGFNGMAAKEMADEIAVTVYNAEGTQVSNTTTTSISAYALKALDNAAYASMHTMMADLLNYGAAAQTFFKYNTANLANANMTEVHKANATKGFDMSKYTNDVVAGPGAVGANLSLETNILQNFYFDPAVVDNTMIAKVSYIDYKGVKKTAEISGSEFGTMPGYGYVIVEVSVLVPADVMSLVSVEIVDANGDVVASVSDSISSYAVRANTSSPDALYIELMEYCLSCEAYFG